MSPLDDLKDSNVKSDDLREMLTELELNPGKLSRRSFITLMSSSVALMSLVGCRRPLEEIVPYVIAPEDALLGIEATPSSLSGCRP